MNTVNITSSLSNARDLRQDLKKKYGADVGRCYQCGKCSAGCPVAFAMDNPPHKVVQMAKLGLYDELLKSRSTWLCATCHTCSARCPRDVQPSRIMEGMRIEARNSSNIGVRALDIFNTKFIDLVEKHGRVHEVALMLWNNILTLRFLKDVQFGPEMLLKRKISIMPHTTETTRDEVQKIFARCRDYKEGKPIGSSFSDVSLDSAPTATPVEWSSASTQASATPTRPESTSGSTKLLKPSSSLESSVPPTSLEPAAASPSRMSSEAPIRPEPSTTPVSSLSSAPSVAPTPSVTDTSESSDSDADSPTILNRFVNRVSNWLYEPDDSSGSSGSSASAESSASDSDQPSGGENK